MWAAHRNEGESYTRPRTRFSTRAIRKQAYFRVIACNRDHVLLLNENFCIEHLCIYITLLRKLEKNRFFECTLLFLKNVTSFFIWLSVKSIKCKRQENIHIRNIRSIRIL